MDNEKLNNIEIEETTKAEGEAQGGVAQAQAALAELQKERGKKIIIAVVIIAVLALIGWRVYDHFFAEDEDTGTSAISVKTAVAQESEIYTEAPITAAIEAGEQVYVVPLMAGKVTSVNAKNGDYVKKGQVLFTIDSLAADTQVTQAAEGVKQAKANLDRMQVLYDAGAISLAEYEAAKSTYNNAASGYKSASASKAYYTVTAPISGYLSSFNVTVGGVVGQSMVGAISDTSDLSINPKVTEKMALKMNVGDTVEIYVSSLDKTYKGTIISVGQVPETGGATYPVEISINNGDSSLKSGMFAEVKVKTDRVEQAVTVPTQAVFTKNGESVAVVLNGNIPKIVKVTTGIDNGEEVEILSGIKAGETVVISGQQYVKDGEEVKVY